MNETIQQERSRQLTSIKTTVYCPIYVNKKILSDGEMEKFFKLRVKNNPKNILRVGAGTPLCHFCAHDNTETEPIQKDGILGVFCAEPECGMYLDYLS